MRPRRYQLGDCLLAVPVPSLTPMARLPRFIIPGIPHHITQRGNGRAQTFFEDGDYAIARATPSLQE